MTAEQFFPATLMPDDDWWHTLWPDPAAVLRQVGIIAGMQVVDLCCGNGHFTQPICQQVHPGKTWALDLDEALLREAASKCRENPNFRSIHGDARELPRQLAEQPDLVFIANTFHGVPDKTALAESVFQVLKPAGVFVIINWHQRPREQTAVLGQPRGPDTELRMSPEQVYQVVEPVGFELDRVTEVSPYHYAAIFNKQEKEKKLT